MQTAPRALAVLEPLLEREDALAVLSAALDEARLGRGRMLLIAGEAGIGKTSLVRSFCRDLDDETRVLEGACDALSTPRPLVPLNDIAAIVGGSFADLVQLGAPPSDVFAAFRDELESGPSVVVLEDLHWADEATLDVLRLLARRVEGLPAVILATYRDDELGFGHPTRVVAGDFATAPAVGRLTLAPLSDAAVAELAAGHDVNVGELCTRTGGNPFFVIEAIAAGDVHVPATVRDAVLARTARLSSGARSVIEALAVVPPRAEHWLLGRIALDDGAHLDECIASGVVTANETGVGFRHELARMAVEESLPPTRRAMLHRTVLGKLAEPPTGAPDVVRLAHHALAADDGEAVLTYAPMAAERAASVGAYREAAVHYASALRFADGLPSEQRAALLERRSGACYLADDQLEAITLLERALEMHREEGAARSQARVLSTLTSYLICRGHFNRAKEAAREASELTQDAPTSLEYARACSVQAVLCMNDNNLEAAMGWARQAFDIADACGYEQTARQALITLGTAELWRDPAGGRRTLERAVEQNRESGHPDLTARALNNLGAAGVHHRSYELADTYLPLALTHCIEHHLDLWRINVLALLARSELDQGRWTAAAEACAALLDDPRESPWPQVEALSVLALVRARRGDPGARTLLDAATAIDSSPEEFESVAALAQAKAEIAWLEQKPAEIDEATAVALGFAARRGDQWATGALADWRRRAGIVEPAPDGVAAPYALQLGGEWSEAAAAWKGLGCPYEEALALAETGDEESLRRALDALQQLGAVPASRLVARRLRERGATGLVRGPRRETRENPAGLTVRELEVLELLGKGLRNKQIADHLFLSTRTVGHHVSAILRKLEAGSRGEAVAAARRLGLLEDQ